MLLLDAGPSSSSTSSTIVDLTGPAPRVIREGAVSRERLEVHLPGLLPSAKGPDAKPEPDPAAEPDPDRDAGSDPEVVPDADSDPPFRILFVCTGNTCRSPMAEGLAREMIRARGWTGVEVSSAGVFASPGAPASEGALEAFSRAGMDLSRHRSRQVGPHLLDESDLVLTMTRSHLNSLAMMDALDVPAATLAMFADPDGALGHGDVSDPIGGPPDVYDATLSELRTLVWEALDRLEEQVEP